MASGKLGCSSGFSSGIPYAYPALKIYLSGDGFQVPGVDATVNAAKVVQVQAFGDGSAQKRVDYPMGQLRPEHAIFALYLQAGIFAIVDGSNPKPTAGHGLWKYQFHSSLEDVAKLPGHVGRMPLWNESVNSTFWKTIQRQGIV